MAQEKDVMSILQSGDPLSVSSNTKKLLKLFTEIAEVQDRANELAAEIYGAESKEFAAIDTQLESCRQYLKKKITARIIDNVFNSKSVAI